MAKLKRVSVLKMASFLGLYGAFIGLIAAIIIALVLSFVSSLFSAATTIGGSASVNQFQFQWANLIIFPLIFGGVNFLLGLIFTPIINLILKIIKGLDVDLGLEDIDDHKPYMPPQNPQIPLSFNTSNWA